MPRCQKRQSTARIIAVPVAADAADAAAAEAEAVVEAVVEGVAGCVEIRFHTCRVVPLWCALFTFSLPQPPMSKH